MYEYSCTVTRIVDGDTLDVDIDLGFSVVLKKQRIRQNLELEIRKKKFEDCFLRSFL